MVPEEEAPQEDDINDSAMAKDNEGFCSDADVSSTAASPKLILIPAPVRASMHNQKAVKGRGTKDHPYKLGFAPAIRRAHGVSLGTHQEQRDHQNISAQLSPCYSPGIGYTSCQARNVVGRYHEVCVHVGHCRSRCDSDCLSDELVSGEVACNYGWCAGSYTDCGGRA